MSLSLLVLVLLLDTTIQQPLHQTCRQGLNCHLPACFCNTTRHHMDIKHIPQIIYFGFDDALTDLVGAHYRDLFSDDRRNPNGCSISMTLYIQHEYTNYSLVRYFYQKGMEIGVHGLSHDVVTRETLKTEAEAQRMHLSQLGNVPLREIVGWRSPFLRTAGDVQPDVLQSLGYEYDISLTGNIRSMEDPRSWPYTLDYGYPHTCMITPCPERDVSHPGFWEVPVNSLMDHELEHPCVFVDGCINRPENVDEAFKYLWTNFQSYYGTNRAPFGLNMHAAWFWKPHNKKAMDRFVDEVLNLPGRDVYIVTVKQMLDWMKRPTPIEKLGNLPSWSSCGKQAPIKETRGTIGKSRTMFNKGHTTAEKEYIPFGKGFTNFIPGPDTVDFIRSPIERKNGAINNVGTPVNSVAALGPRRHRTRHRTVRVNHVARTNSGTRSMGQARVKSSKRNQVDTGTPRTKPHYDPPRMPGYFGKPRGTRVMSQPKVRTGSGRSSVLWRRNYFRSTKTADNQPHSLTVPRKTRVHSRANIRRRNGGSGRTIPARHTIQERELHSRGTGGIKRGTNGRFRSVFEVRNPVHIGRVNIRHWPGYNARMRSRMNKSGKRMTSPTRGHANASVVDARNGYPRSIRNKAEAKHNVGIEQEDRTQIVYDRGHSYHVARHYTSVPEGTWIFGPRVEERVGDDQWIVRTTPAARHDDVARSQGHREFHFSRIIQSDSDAHHVQRANEYTNTHTESDSGGIRTEILNKHRTVGITRREFPANVDHTSGKHNHRRVHYPLGYLRIVGSRNQMESRRSKPRYPGSGTGAKAERKRGIIASQNTNTILHSDFNREKEFNVKPPLKRPRPRIIGFPYPRENGHTNSQRYHLKNRVKSFQKIVRRVGTDRETNQNQHRTIADSSSTGTTWGNDPLQSVNYRRARVPFRTKPNISSNRNITQEIHRQIIQKSSDVPIKRSISPKRKTFLIAKHYDQPQQDKVNAPLDNTRSHYFPIGVGRNVTGGYSKDKHKFEDSGSQRTDTRQDMSLLERQHHCDIQGQHKRDITDARERINPVEGRRRERSGYRTTHAAFDDVYAKRQHLRKYRTRVQRSHGRPKSHGVNRLLVRAISLPTGGPGNERIGTDHNNRSTIHDGDASPSVVQHHSKRGEIGFNNNRRRLHITRRLYKRRKRQVVGYHGRRRRNYLNNLRPPSRTTHKPEGMISPGSERGAPTGSKMSAGSLATPHSAVCSQDSCRLPRCFCRSTSPPGGLPVEQIPQIVVLTFDGSVSWSTFPIYDKLFQSSRRNPNGCPISGTFFVPSHGNSGEQLNQLVAKGMEIAVKGHSRNISDDMHYLQHILPLASISGWKSDQKPMSGKEFDEMNGSLMTYDSSLHLPLHAPFNNRSWPYTLDYRWQDCDRPGCPSSIQEGLWEVPVTPLLDYKGSYKCVYADGCYWNPPTSQETYTFLWNNFQRHYTGNRAPIGFAFRQAWFHAALRHNRNGLERFVDKLATLGDTYVISIGRLLQWMKQPTSLLQVSTFPPWQC